MTFLISRLSELFYPPWFEQRHLGSIYKLQELESDLTLTAIQIGSFCTTT